MISNIMPQRSFGKNIAYCLEDKLSVLDQQVIYKDRAEVLHYNRCYGNKEELTQQFDEIAQTNLKMSVPVIHIVLTFHPEEKLPKSRLVEIAQDCAKQMAFDTHQYIAVLHKDQAHQHMHLLVNKVGFDGKSVNDSHSYRRMVNFCRETEQKYELRPALSPRCYLSEEQRNVPRQGVRLEKLQQAIENSLRWSPNYHRFEGLMMEAGYYTHKTGRGIAFEDFQNVVFRGSEVGYPLRKIEETLAIDQALRQFPELTVWEKEQLALKAQQERAQRQMQEPEERQALPIRPREEFREEPEDRLSIGARESVGQEEGKEKKLEQKVEQKPLPTIKPVDWERMRQLPIHPKERPDRGPRLRHRM